MKFDIPDDSNPIIKVIGVGGGGSNAVNYMYEKKIVGVDFAICNTDNQAMNLSAVVNKIQLGPTLTEGRGAGSKPGIGRESCIESLDEVKQYFSDGTKMLFVTAGMGGGTGTGAAPVIAKAAQELDILTVGIVTVPFTFEGRRRMKQAMEGLAELKKNVDTLIVISNDKLRKIYGNLNLSEAFSKADDILMTAAKGIAEIITVPGYVNVDFEDVNTVMRDSGVAVMGTATTEGDDRAIRAVEAALQSPLLEDNDIKGAQHILLNITSGTKEVTMDEVFEITEYVQEEAGYGTDLIWGNCFDESLGEQISVTVIATGFETGQDAKKMTAREERPVEKKVRVALDDDEPTTKKSTSGSFFNKDLDSDHGSIEFNFSKKKQSSDKPKYSIEKEPFVKPDTQKEEPKVVEKSETLEERRQRLKNLSVKLNNPEVLNELENQPAYLRKGIALDNVEHSSDSNVSQWTISDDDEPEVKDNNSFLHDNVD
ncbi:MULTISPECIES: cell division protein FtsZ [unclassified Aureispira]|uniref:cell division protein FtsZ n=1 Tax=unclassified Aureispira TaxID=2649989 RepID=UPI00069744AB|nr:MULTISPECIES: cell division protein FtsZ [unclassified Aureispira]WMX13821.1 cell division protein FtsZ [Aureispira sp. CCB-E]